MSGMDLKLIDSAQVPTPGQGRALFFLGLDGLARTKMAGGVVSSPLAGLAGLKGEPGNAGQDGTNGTNGADGLNGLNGLKGDPGNPGQDGTNGINGANPVGAILAFNEYLGLNNPVNASSSILIASNNLSNSPAGKGVHATAVLDCSAAATISFTLNCGGMLFTTGNLTFNAARRVYIEYRAVIASSIANSFAWHSLQGAAIGGAVGVSFNSLSASGALPSGGLVELRANCSAGQLRVRLAQLQVMYGQN